MRVYYNEFDKKKCAALKALMDDGHIRKGDIDDRSIRDVQPEDVKGYDRAHFFAGIGLWDYAIDLAGWPEDRPVWTGSCPCQPYSSAGRQKGQADDRHLWPEWLRLIGECRPATIFGEQVTNAISFGWLDDVYQGLEAQGYAVGSAVLPACSVGAPHRRDRLWFVADLQGTECERVRPEQDGKQNGFTDGCVMGNAQHNGSSSNPIRGSGQKTILDNAQGQDSAGELEGASASRKLPASPLGDSIGAGSQGHGQSGKVTVAQRRQGTQRYPWQSGVWIDCSDGKQRLVEPGISLLAHGYPERVGIIHCAGDAIVPKVAAGFITAFWKVKRNEI